MRVADLFATLWIMYYYCVSKLHCVYYTCFTFSASKLLLISAPSNLVCLSALAVSAPLSFPTKYGKKVTCFVTFCHSPDHNVHIQKCTCQVNQWKLPIQFCCSSSDREKQVSRAWLQVVVYRELHVQTANLCLRMIWKMAWDLDECWFADVVPDVLE